jgi:hypothetical protein
MPGLHQRNRFWKTTSPSPLISASHTPTLISPKLQAATKVEIHPHTKPSHHLSKNPHSNLKHLPNLSTHQTNHQCPAEHATSGTGQEIALSGALPPHPETQNLTIAHTPPFVTYLSYLRADSLHPHNQSFSPLSLHFSLFSCPQLPSSLSSSLYCHSTPPTFCPIFKDGSLYTPLPNTGCHLEKLAATKLQTNSFTSTLISYVPNHPFSSLPLPSLLISFHRVSGKCLVTSCPQTAPLSPLCQSQGISSSNQNEIQRNCEQSLTPNHIMHALSSNLHTSLFQTLTLSNHFFTHTPIFFHRTDIKNFYWSFILPTSHSSLFVFKVLSPSLVPIRLALTHPPFRWELIPTIANSVIHSIVPHYERAVNLIYVDDMLTIATVKEDCHQTVCAARNALSGAGFKQMFFLS